MYWTDSGRYARQQVPAGTVLFEEGAFGDTMYMIVVGQLQVSKRMVAGADKVLTILGAGQYVGEMSLLRGAQRSATVKALTDTEVIEIDQDAFMQLLQDEPQVGLEIMRQLAHRVQETTEEMILTALELALVQRDPQRMRTESQRMRFLATGSFAKEKTREVLHIAAQQITNKQPAMVTSLWRPGRTTDALIYLIATENPRDIVALITPFAELVQWDISLAMDVVDVFGLLTGHDEKVSSSYLSP